MPDPQTTLYVQKDKPAQVGNFGANGATPQAAYALPVAGSDAATTQALANAMRLALIAAGICAAS